MPIERFTKTPNSIVHKSVDDPTMLLVAPNLRPDVVTLPPVLGGTTHRVLDAFAGACPKCSGAPPGGARVPAKHLSLEGTSYLVAECSRSCGFVWYTIAAKLGEPVGKIEPVKPALLGSTSPGMIDYDGCTSEQWSAFFVAMSSGARMEISESIYWYFLEVLPPHSMGKTVPLKSGVSITADFCFVEGADVITAFWKERKNGCDHYYLEQTTLRSKGG